MFLAFQAHGKIVLSYPFDNRYGRVIGFDKWNVSKEEMCVTSRWKL